MKKANRLIGIMLSCAMMLGMMPTAGLAQEEHELLVPQYTYTGGGLTFEKISHVNTPLEQPDGIVDYAGSGFVAVHDPNGETDLAGDRGQSYSYAAASYGDWVYIGTMYGGLGAANIISSSMTSAGMDRETALAVVNAMYNGRLYISEPDGANAGGIFFKFNVKTGETVILMSKNEGIEGGVGIIPTFRSACEVNGKLYFVGMIQDVELMAGQPAVRIPGYDMLNEAIMMQNGLPVIYEVTPSNEADGDVLTRIYDCVEDDLDIYRSMVEQNMFTSTRAIGTFRDTLIAGCMDENGPFLTASADPSAGQESFKEIADLDDLFGYPAYKRNDASGGGGIYQVVEYGGNLYVAIVTGHANTHNQETGTKRSFAIVRGEIAEGADPTDKSSWTWSVLVGDPADGAKYPFGIDETRVSTNACTLQVYNDHLYIGDYNDVSSALQGFISGKSFRTQATNLEQSLNLYRMNVDEEIEMVVGDPNPTFPDGGISGLGSGYDSHMNQYHWQTTVFDGKMYLSTMDTTSLLMPLAQFTNGDILKMTKEEWKSQINYIRVLLELLLKSVSFMPGENAMTSGTADTDVSRVMAEALVKDAIEAARARKNGKNTDNMGETLFRAREDDSEITLTEEQIQSMIDGILDGSYRFGEITETLLENLNEINAKLDAMEDLLQEKVSEEFQKLYEEVLDALEALKAKIPASVMGLYNMLVSFITRDNIVDILKSLKYLITSEAGFDLYALEELADGSVVIETVTDNGFGDPNNHGLRVFTETDDYLVIGTANPFFGTQLWRTAIERNPEPEDPNDSDAAKRYMPAMFSLRVSSTDGGKANAEGNLLIARYAGRTLRFTPDEGYCISDVLVNGKSVGAVDQYRIVAAVCNYNIEVIFEEIAVETEEIPAEQEA